MTKVKVIGYSKTEYYNGGIQYRNFSDSLVGNQFTTNGGNTLFTLGNFSVTTNLESRLTKSYKTNSFSRFYNLNNLQINKDKVLLGTLNTKTLKLNYNKKKLNNYAYFGSLREFIRVELENIITNWPASIKAVVVDSINPNVNNNLFIDYTYNPITNKATFKTPIYTIQNKYGIMIKDGENDTSDRNLNIGFDNYVLSIGNDEYQISNFIGYREDKNYLDLEVIGNPFNVHGNVDFHIKPNKFNVNEFFLNLSDFGKHILNRQSVPLYRSIFEYDYESENGGIIYGSKEFTWPVSDGYNIDFNSDYYVDFVSDILEIADNLDSNKTNIIKNRLVPSAIYEFDTNGAKVEKLLNIYGRNFDDIKRQIDGLKYINNISYNKENNVPDGLVKSLARTMGWEVTTSLFNIDFNENYLSSGGLLGLSPVETEIEFWRRLTLNTPWIWKSKGTRKVIEFLLDFIGTPRGLVTFNEYVYKANNTISRDTIIDILEENGIDYLEEEIVVDDNGYPKILNNNPDNYFQKGGQWFRETAGDNANIDKSTGNNPHIGPYDKGSEYIEQFNNIISNFSSGVISEVKTLVKDYELYKNYDDGTFDKYLDNDETLTTYVQLRGSDNLPILDNSITFEDSVIPNKDNSNDGVYRIKISKQDQIEENSCGYKSFELDGTGLLLFTYLDDSVDYTITSECCSSLGFTPELNNNGRYVCRWKAEEVNPCDQFNKIDRKNSEGYQLFINNVTGELTSELPTSECCSNVGLVAVNNGDTFYCEEPDIIGDECSDFEFTGDFDSNGYGLFILGDESVTTVFSEECCEANDLGVENVNGDIKCIEIIEGCESYTTDGSTTSEGYIIFENSDGLKVVTFTDSECCGEDYESEVQNDGTFRCKEPIDESLPTLNRVGTSSDGDSAILDMRINGTPNSTVKYRVYVNEISNHGFLNDLFYTTNNQTIMPSLPAPSVGSFCTGSVTLDENGEAYITMNTTSRPPIRLGGNTCTNLEFSIYDYDNNTIKDSNKLTNISCSSI